MGLFDFIGRAFSQDARDNYDLYKSGRANKNEKVYTSIRPDLGDDKTTASGYAERSRPAYKNSIKIGTDDD